MKKLLLLSALSIALAVPSFAQLKSTPPSGGNQRSFAKQYLGKFAYVAINYSSPDVAGREGQIWGQLVPYGLNNLGFGQSSEENPSPWRAGANENTTIKFSHDMEIQGKAIKAGKYGFHMIPAESGPWQILLTKENQAWGSFFYTSEDEVLRVETNSEASEFHEYLTFEFTERKVDQVTVALMWENLAIPFEITMPNQNDVILASIKSEMNGATGFGWNNVAAAANWASGAGYHEEAVVWSEAAISAPFIGQKNFQTLSTKANVMFAAEKNDEALTAVDELMKDPSATAFQLHGLGRQLIGRGQPEKALEVFKYNQKANKGAWPTNYGLARGYSANGDYKNALKYLKIAKTKVPDGDTQNPPVIEANIKKLENKEDIN